MKEKKVLIIVDNGVRDLLSCRLLQEEFKKRGVNAVLTDTRRLKPIVRGFEPDAVIVPRGDWPYLRDLAKACRLYLVPCEGSRMTLRTMMSVFLGRVHKADVLSNGKRIDQSSNVIKDFDFLRKVYLWGPQTFNFLSNSKFFRSEQLMITGSVKIEIYRHIQQKRRAGKDFTVGVAFSARATSSFYGRMNYATTLFNFEEKAQLPMVPKGRHWEDYAWRDFAILRRMLNIIKGFLDNHRGKILLRVNPFENPQDYEFLKKIYPGRIEIQDDNGELYEFVNNIDVLLTCWSTTGLDSLICKVPVIAIPFLIDRERLLDHVDPEANGFNSFLPCYHLPESEEEVIDMLEKARLGELEVTPNPELFNSLLKDMYNWPLTRNAVEVTVEDILKDMELVPFEKKTSFKEAMSFHKPIEAVMSVLSIFTKKGAFKLLECLYQTKFTLQDMLNGRLKGARRHHMIRNPHVESVIEEYKRNKETSEIIKEEANEEIREAVH